MLGKLLKHEFKATARLLLPIYLLLVVLTIIDRIVLSLDFRGSLSIVTGFVTFAYVATLIAIIVVSFVIIALRFYKNLLSDEGYLMFTLPTKQSALINSKLIVSFIWNIAGVLAIFLSLFCVFINSVRMDRLRDGWHMVMDAMQEELGTGNTTLFFIEVFLLIIIGTLNGILMVYVSMAIGQLFNTHRVLGSFAAYIGISTVLQIIITAGTAILGMSFYKAFDFDEITTIPRVVFPLSIAYATATTILFYWLTNLLFKKKLNLE